MDSGKIGRVWDEGFNSDLGVEVAVVLVISNSPFSACYLKLKAPARLFIVGDSVSWKGDSLWWRSKLLEKTILVDRVGKAFVDYNTSRAFMISEWRES